jgi:hypothetical protein
MSGKSGTVGVASEVQTAVERILASILAPVSKILIKNNINLSVAVEILKESLVKGAIEEGADTNSLISLKTGVHRKDVNRLRNASDIKSSEKPPTKGLAIVLSLWANDDRFRDNKGQPRILYRNAADGFDSLVRASKVDIAPPTVLRELATQNLVLQHEDGGIELLSPTFIAQIGDAALKAFEATVSDHLRVATNNVLSAAGSPRDFDQVVRYSHLSSASVARLEAEARKLASEYLAHMNAMAHRLQSEDDALGNLSNGRFVSGVFVAPSFDQATTTSAKKDKDQ